jgi:hypothetical protein
MSARRGYLLLSLLLGLVICLPALAQGGTIKASPQATAYTVELPGEVVKEQLCTGDIRTRTTTCAEVPATLCKITEVKFREGIAGAIKTCTVSGCSPKQGAGAATGKCECKVKISDCR